MFETFYISILILILFPFKYLFISSYQLNTSVEAVTSVAIVYEIEIVVREYKEAIE